MVEGPGATRNGRKVQPVVGLILREIKIQRPLHKSNVNVVGSSAQTIKKVALEGRHLESVFSVGKEVFLLLGPVVQPIRREWENENPNTTEEQKEHQQQRPDSDMKPIALRLHFGMNGVLTVRKLGESSKLAPWRKNDKSAQKCTIAFSRSPFVHGNESDRCIPEVFDTVVFVIETVASTCTVVSAFVARSKLNRLQSKDVCARSTNFEPEAVLEAILEKRLTAMVCDAILDQDRFPGVGNIIKIEGLHKAGVHPRRLVEKLTREELKRVITECRAYAMGWLSTGRAPTKQVYNRTKCGSCKTGRVRMVKMGKDLSRVTFWCENCQPFAVATATAATKSSPVASYAIQSNILCDAKSKKVQQTQTPPVLSSCCPQHGSKTILLRRVRKTGSANLHRLFRTCRIRDCPYFSWADSHLPSCGCRHKTVLRVSKTERTGGRWFLSCAASSSLSSHNYNQRPKSNTCSFFQWATPSQVRPFADDLSPLT